MELEELNVARKLERWRVNELERLITVFDPETGILESDKSLNKTDYIHHLIEKENEKLQEFYEYREQLKSKGISINESRTVLNDKYEVDNEKLDEISTGSKILLVIYEEKLVEEIDVIAELSSVSGKSSDFKFILKEDVAEDEEIFKKDIEKVVETVEEFQSVWNEEKVPIIKVDVVKTENEEIVFRIYHEYSTNKRYEYFEFQENDDKEKDLKNLNVKSTGYNPVTKKTVKMDLDRKDSLGMIFGENPDQWSKRILDGLLEHLFGEDITKEDLELPVYEEAKEIQETYEETIEQDKSWENIKESIGARKKQAKDEVEGSDLRSEEKKAVKDKIDDIDLAGNDVEDQPEIGIYNQTLVADLDTYTESVPGGEQQFEYVMKQADKENFNLKLRMDSKEVTVKENDFDPDTNLTDTEDKALRFFMGDRKDE